MKINKLQAALLGRVVVAGAGASGLAAFRFMADQRPKSLTIVDDGVISAEVREALLRMSPSAKIFDRGMPADELIQADVIVLSPGIPLSNAKITAAREKGGLVVNEIEVATAFLPKCRFVGITGTNGKSTVTAMLGAIAKEFSAEAFVGGNLGRPLCEALSNGELPALAVLELSSFQLELISHLPLEVALVTNLAPDHLDRYAEVADYYHAKGRILELVSKNGAVFFGGNRDLSSSLSASPIKDLKPFASNSVAIPREIETVPHNLENAQLAIQAALSLGISKETIELGLRNYRPLAHRFERLGDINGVTWINDSKATNVDATIAGMQGFNRNVHIILGGLGKKNDYHFLADKIKHALKAVYAVGQDALEISEVFSPLCPTILSLTIDKAVEAAMKKAVAGDVLILCPACASYDQFKNYLERGDFFRRLFFNLYAAQVSIVPSCKDY